MGHSQPDKNKFVLKSVVWSETGACKLIKQRSYGRESLFQGER